MSATILACPDCGWSGHDSTNGARAFRFVSEVTSLRWVIGIDSDGVLRVEAEELIAAEEGHRLARLQCGRCLTEFDLPKGLAVEFAC